MARRAWSICHPALERKSLPASAFGSSNFSPLENNTLMTPSRITCSLYYYYLGINSQKWEGASGRSTLMALYMWGQIAFHTDHTISHWPQGCMRMPVSTRSPLMTLYSNLGMFWSCNRSHLLDVATCMTGHFIIIHSARVTHPLATYFVKLCAPIIKVLGLRCDVFVIWDNKHLFESSLSLIEPVHE